MTSKIDRWPDPGAPATCIPLPARGPRIEVGAGAILVGDAREQLRHVPEASCRCAITSPPYWGLRLYGGGDLELGREPNVDEYVAAMLDTLRLVREALTLDGTLWLNLGDCYARSGGRGGGYGTSSKAHPLNRMANEARRRYTARAAWGGTPDKGLVGLPWRVGLMLQADGWIWRAVVPWIKRNAMPENVGDRPPVSIEYVLMFARSERTYYNADAVRRPYSSQPTSSARVRGRGGRGDGYSTPGRVEHHALGRLMRTGDFFFDSLRWAIDDGYEGLVVADDGAPIALITSAHPSDSGHVAVYPEQLIEPLVLVSSQPGDTVLDPFLGSGTTAIVAQRNGRRWLGCEILEATARLAADRVASKAAQMPMMEATHG